MSARIIALTNDVNLEAVFSEGLEGHALCEQLLFASSAAQLSRIMDVHGSNVLLLDTETQRITDSYLVSLKEKFKLYVILFGTANSANYMRYGFTDIMNKPADNSFSINIFKRGLLTKIEDFIKLGKTSWHQPTAGRATAPVFQAAPEPAGGSSLYVPNATVDARQRIIAITASTGGTEAILTVLRDLPPNVPPVLIVQHMPAGFTKQFADRLDKHCRFTVKEAATGDFLRRGLALLAPGDFHMRLAKKGSALAVECVQTAHVHSVRPAADVLFQSIPPIMNGNAVGVVLTGMGSDGARGLLAMKSKGAKVIGQDEASSVVYGMPKAAYDIGAVDYQVPLVKVAETIMRLV